MISKILAGMLTAGMLCGSSLAGADSYSPQHDAVQKLFQSEAEKTAKDALWTSPRMFKVGVIDNGSNRDGYANYVCEVLYEHGFKGQRINVQVIDIVRLSRNGKWEKLGAARCL